MSATALTYTDTASVYLKNSFPFAVQNILLKHKYSDDPEQSITWTNVAAGSIPSNALTVGYNTGFIRTGQDHWQITVTLPDGVQWVSDWHQCTMRSADSGKSLTFEVNSQTFFMNMPSGNCTTSMYGQNSYNSLAVVQVKNDFPVAANIKLTHQYSSNKVQTSNWSQQVEPGQMTDSTTYFIVYFKTGDPGLDYWNIEVVLNVPPYDGQPAQAFSPWKNGKKDKECQLQSADRGKTIVFVINGMGWQLPLPSGGCTDKWLTPNGYNTTAFIKVKNNFKTAIHKIVMTHQYSSDAVYTQTRTTIPVGQDSALMFVEYLTGWDHPGYDYWNITVYLTDQRYYKNSKTDKRCYMTQADSSGVLEFAVSDTNFLIGLTSGACNDGMTLKGQADYFLGREVSRRYSENAYLAAHNAFANFADGFWYAQQSASLSDQLAQGVSCLLLDIWDYEGDVCLIHQTPWLQPFTSPAKLSDGLAGVADYMSCNPTAVVTIVFEDKVATLRNKIKPAFQAVPFGSATLWDSVFFADRPNKGWSVAAQGWPTLQWMIDNGLRLVVFSSVANPFPAQWSYMSENVYSDASLDKATWLNNRGESQPLDNLALCALNHFPTWAPSAVNTWLTTWLSKIAVVNQKSTAIEMFNACKARWNRLPNFWQVDFVELPNQEPGAAVYTLNQMLHNKPVNAPVIQHSVVLLNESPADNLLASSPRTNLSINWKRLTSALDFHSHGLASASPTIDPRDGQAFLLEKLLSFGDSSVVIYGLLSGQEAPLNGDAPAWAAQKAVELADQIEAVDAKIAWHGIPSSDLTTPTIMRACLPMALLSQKTGKTFDGLDRVTQALNASPETIAAARESGHADVWLFLQTLGLADTLPWADRLLQHMSVLSATGEDLGPAGVLYGLCHEVFYSTRFGARPDIDGVGDAERAKLIDTLLNQANLYIDRANQDLAAELIVAYWYLGGDFEPTQSILKALTQLRLDLGPLCETCAPKASHGEEGLLVSRDQMAALKQRHELWTTIFAMGVALSKSTPD